MTGTSALRSVARRSRNDMRWSRVQVVGTKRGLRSKSSAPQCGDLPGQAFADTSEPFCNERVTVVFDMHPLGSFWRGNACPSSSVRRPCQEIRERVRHAGLELAALVFASWWTHRELIDLETNKLQGSERRASSTMDCGVGTCPPVMACSCAPGMVEHRTLVAGASIECGVGPGHRAGREPRWRAG